MGQAELKNIKTALLAKLREHSGRFMVFQVERNEEKKKSEIQTEETSKLANSNLIFSYLKRIIFNTFDISQSVLNIRNLCSKGVVNNHH